MSTVDICDYLNVKDAAKLIGCTEGRVRQLLIADQIRGEKINSRAWLVEKKDAERVRDIAPRGGMPRIGRKSRRRRK